jgi:hypothetical protein
LVVYQAYSPASPNEIASQDKTITGKTINARAIVQLLHGMINQVVLDVIVLSAVLLHKSKIGSANIYTTSFETILSLGADS